MAGDAIEATGDVNFIKVVGFEDFFPFWEVCFLLESLVWSMLGLCNCGRVWEGQRGVNRYIIARRGAIETFPL